MSIKFISIFQLFTVEIRPINNIIRVFNFVLFWIDANRKCFVCSLFQRQTAIRSRLVCRLFETNEITTPNKKCRFVTSQQRGFAFVWHTTRLVSAPFIIAYMISTYGHSFCTFYSCFYRAMLNDWEFQTISVIISQV